MVVSDADVAESLTNSARLSKIEWGGCHRLPNSRRYESVVDWKIRFSFDNYVMVFDTSMVMTGEVEVGVIGEINGSSL
jgi:hypothetical protein